MTASIREARAKLSELVQAAAKGEDVIITSHGQPCAKIVAIPPASGKTLNMDKIRRLAKKAWTGKRGGSDATKIISDMRDERW